jgi:5-methylthioadenosine/S-adenosylhomocysteine deaminase
MLGEARMAATLGVPALEALRLVTLGGATALGFANDIGSIEPGKYADLVCVRVDEPGFNMPESLLFGATRAQVSDVWTSGRAALGAFDQDELVASAQKWLRIGGAT